MSWVVVGVNVEVAATGLVACAFVMIATGLLIRRKEQDLDKNK
jgi:hypothetical protein